MRIKGWLLALILLGTTGGTPAQPPQFDHVLLCKTVDEHNRPIDPSLVYIPTDDFFCSFQVHGVTLGTRVGIRWYRGNALLQEDAFAVNQEGDANLYFACRHTSGPWVPGAYHADLLVGDQVQQSLPFSVSGDAAAQLMDATLCRTFSNDLEPVDPTRQYGVKEPFYCSLKLDNGQVGEDISMKWFYGTELLHETHILTKLRSPHFLAFWLGPKGQWLPGAYTAEVYIDGQLARTLSFTVQ